MNGAEVLLWPAAAVLVFLALWTLQTRCPALRPWLLGATLVYLVGSLGWWVTTQPDDWRPAAVLAVVLGYGLWVGEVVRRRSD